MKLKIIFFSNEGLYGNLIKLGTKSDWTHVGVIADETKQDYIVYEALNKGLVKTNHRKYIVNDRIKQKEIVIKYVELRISKERLKKICESYLGRPYDWLTIFNIGIYFLFGHYALNLPGPRKLICSEFAARVLYDASNKKLNLSKEFDKRYDYITPEDLYKSNALKA